MTPETRRTMPWAKVFRVLCERYGWKFSDLGEMTMYQVLVASGMWCPEDIIRVEES